MNATNGGSSGNQLPISAEMLEHRDAMAPLLRIDYSCVSQVLQALSNIAHVVSFVPSKSLTVEALDEFSLFPIPDGLVSHVAEYVFCVWSSVHGRKSARDKIVEFFNCVMLHCFNNTTMKYFYTFSPVLCTSFYITQLILTRLP